MRQTFFNITSLRGSYVLTGVAYLSEGVAATSTAGLSVFYLTTFLFVIDLRMFRYDSALPYSCRFS